MSQTTYKTLDKLVRDMILEFTSSDEFQISILEAQNRAGVSENVVGEGITGVADALVGDIRRLVRPNLLTGLAIIASEPVNDFITISSGAGHSFGKKYVLNRTIATQIPFEDDVSLYFVNLFDGQISVETGAPEEKLVVGKIIIPHPGLTNKVQNDKDRFNFEDQLNAYIVSARDLFFDDTVILDDNSRDVLKDALGTISFKQLSGDLILTENIRIRNERSTINIDSNALSIFFENSTDVSALFNAQGTFYFNEAGDEVARYTKNDTRIGNIKIIPNAIQSINFLSNFTGFRIQDNGDAEFNNIKLRGTLFTSTIEENLFISEGVVIIGDFLLSESDLCIDADQKLIWDCDLGQDTYSTYNSSSQYLEFYIDGQKRLEL